MRAALISLVRNEDLQGIVSSMRQLEAVWNSKYNYPWIFFNNVPFTEEFKKRTQAETKAECRYGTYNLTWTTTERSGFLPGKLVRKAAPDHTNHGCSFRRADSYRTLGDTRLDRSHKAEQLYTEHGTKRSEIRF